MSEDIAISVKNVTKTFKLPHEKHSSLKSTVINFRRSQKGYEEQRVLDDISFDIKKGEFFGIVGRNGSGKSTLLKLLAGIYIPNKGVIQVNGKLTPFIELGVGFNPELTGSENVYLNGALLGFNRKEMMAMYDDIVEFAELKRFMDQKLKNYSSGMQVRLAFSIAIRAQSDILLIDEVLAVGDANFQRKCFDYFQKLKAAKRTVVFVSHDVAAVRQMCDRAMLMSKGKIVKTGSGAEIANDYLIANAPTDNTSKADAKSSGSANDKRAFIATVGKVTVLNLKGKKQSVFGPREPLRVRFAYTNPTQRKLHFGAQIFDAHSQYCFGTNSKLGGAEPVTASNGIVEVDIYQVLGNGNYSVSVATMDEAAIQLIDYKQNAAYFVVNTGEAFEGLLTLNHEWRI